MRSLASIMMLALAVAAVGCATEATNQQSGTPAPVRADGGSAAPAMPAGALGGTVLETQDASNYTYIRFESPEGEIWAAVPQTSLEVGQQVMLANAQLMTGFESKTLERQFDEIYFGTLAGAAAGSTGGAPAAPRGSTVAADAGPIDVDKADGPNARTVAELYEQTEGLDGQVVAIRGQVVKYSSGIMGRNWIHLQDGSGDSGSGTHDITVTSTETTSVGEVVTVQGTVAVDKDFGAGYRYALIVEEASVD